MQTYSPFFQTLYDEQVPVGFLGRGTHYSVLRATVFHDEFGVIFPSSLYHNAIAKYHDFAVLWDEDHDIRIIKVLEKIYQEGLLACFSFYGERKAGFTALYSQEYLAKSKNEQCFEITVRNLCTDTISKEYNDVWNAEISTINNPLGIIQAPDEDINIYLKNILLLWKLGLKNIP